MLLHTHLDADGAKNVTVRVRGQFVRHESVLFFDRGKLRKDMPFRDLLLSSALWTVNEKLGLFIWSDETRRNAEDLVLLMESRNAVQFEREIGFPAEWDGKLWLEPFNLQAATNGWFMFFLELDKVGK